MPIRILTVRILLLQKLGPFESFEQLNQNVRFRTIILKNFSEMALWDPEAAGNAAVYLRLDNLKLIDIRNAPFEGKTACWIPYAETGYTRGKKTGKEETDEKTKVKKVEVERLVDGKMKMFKEEDVEPQNPPKYELLEDMANMTYLSEASVVHNLKSRYEIFLIYTVS